MFHDFAEELGEKGTIHGQLMCDQMKLRSGFYANFQDCSATAMAASLGMSTLSLAEELQQLIEREERESTAASEADSKKSPPDDASDDNNYTDAMYVNVFHLKTSNGLAHNAEYFFDVGSLSSDDLLGDLVWVITMCKIVGTQIHKTDCDAGGPNTGTVNSLHHEQNTPIGWLPEECVSFKNMVFPDCWVRMMLCNVHNFKNY
jgi:hypothetical protein